MSVPAPSSRPSHTVLIVEDDPGMLEYLERVVRDAGFRAITATDGLEVIEKLAKFTPDAAVLDLMLPKYGGLELLYELRRGSAARVPLIIVTARFTGASDKALIIKQPNVAAFFEKPIDAEVLVNALRHVFDKAP